MTKLDHEAHELVQANDRGAIGSRGPTLPEAGPGQRSREQAQRLSSEIWRAFQEGVPGAAPGELGILRYALPRSEIVLEQYPAEILADPLPEVERLWVVTSDEVTSWPLVRGCVECAPLLPRGVAVAALRPALRPASALALVEKRMGVDLRRARFRIGFVRGHLLRVVVALPPSTFACKVDVQEAAELLLESLAGQQRFQRWVGEVEVVPAVARVSLTVAGQASDQMLSSADVLAAIKAAERGVEEELPREPWSRTHGSEWVLLELTPEPPGSTRVQSDLALLSTCCPEIMKAFLSDMPFDSARFSKHEELFAYVSVDQPGVSPRELLALRDAGEEQVDAALRRIDAGAVVGAGLGLRRFYLQLALRDVEASITRLQEVARVLGWVTAELAFMDSERAGETVLL